MRRSTTARGYGWQHQKAREAYIRAWGNRPCVRCGHPITEGQPVDLARSEDRLGYSGLSHAVCNRRAVGQRAHVGKVPGGPCAVDGCDAVSRTRGLCNRHYIRLQRYGSPLGSANGDGWEAPTSTVEREARARVANARWRAENSDVLRMHNQAYRARRRGQFVEHVKLEVLIERDRERCGICRRKVKPSDFSIDHILPLAHGGEHSYANARLTHLRCNVARRDRGAAQLRLPMGAA